MPWTTMELFPRNLILSKQHTKYMRNMGTWEPNLFISLRQDLVG